MRSHRDTLFGLNFGLVIHTGETSHSEPPVIVTSQSLLNQLAKAKITHFLILILISNNIRKYYYVHTTSNHYWK